MMSFIVQYWVEILFSSLCTAIAYMFKQMKSVFKKQKAVEQGVQALLRNELIRRYREYEVKGELTILDKENIELMYKEYKNLGGNGMIESMYKDLMALETKIIK